MKIDLASMTDEELQTLKVFVKSRVEAAQAELRELERYITKRNIEDVVARFGEEGLFNGKTA